MKLPILRKIAEPVNAPVFRFNAVGGRERASSRLRVWMLAEFLAKQGFETHVNGGSRFDILVCQKTYPFLLARNARRAGKTVLFDLDDPDFDISPRWMDKIRRFMQLAHGVTTGSGYLKEKLEQFHPTAHVLENPVDVTDPQVFYKGTPWRGKSVWFGAPENLWMLRRLKLRHPVQTLTKGGDIPYKLKTVDRELCGFNLALLPVFLNEETLAKNANRLVKCAALGLPFLASDTPEHRKAIHRIGVPEDFLVREDQNWDEKIESVAQDYEKWKCAAHACRASAWDCYGAERVFSGWLTFCLEVWQQTRAEANAYGTLLKGNSAGAKE